MTARRRKVYLGLAAAFPVFFLLHWNGFVDLTYSWALEETGSTRRPAAQTTAALLSATIIFAALAALVEVITGLSRRRG